MTRIAELRGVRCSVRFISFEPLLERIRRTPLGRVHWAIIGGESGPHCRGMDPEWVDSLILQCRRDGVPVFFKQWGGRTPKANGRLVHGKAISEYPAGPAGRARGRARQALLLGAAGAAGRRANDAAASGGMRAHWPGRA